MREILRKDPKIDELHDELVRRGVHPSATDFYLSYVPVPGDPNPLVLGCPVFTRDPLTGSQVVTSLVQLVWKQNHETGMWVPSHVR